MSTSWAIIILLAVTTMLARASGPLIIGRRELPSWSTPLIAVLPAALLTALIVVQVFTDGDRVVVDERLGGLAAAAIVLWWRRQSLILAMVAAAVVVAVLRAL